MTDRTHVRPHNIVARLLAKAEGAFVTKESLLNQMSEDRRIVNEKQNLLYRLSSNITNIRVYENGVVAVEKDGRNTVAFKLVNWETFDDQGFGTDRAMLTKTYAVRRALKEARKAAQNGTVEEQAAAEYDAMVASMTPEELEAIGHEVAETPAETSEVVAEEPVAESFPVETAPVAEFTPVVAKPKRDRSKKNAAVAPVVEPEVDTSFQSYGAGIDAIAA